MEQLGELMRQGMERLGVELGLRDAREMSQVSATPCVQGEQPPLSLPTSQASAAHESSQPQGAAAAEADIQAYHYRALFSVHDKEGVVQLAKELHGAMKVQLVSTGSTHRLLTAAEIPVCQLDSDSGFPEVLDGKWGTRCMSNALHAQVVARRQRLHESEELRGLGLAPMDLVVANLFLFGSTLQSHTSAEESIEDIDIGTSTIIRAAARNYPNVIVLIDPLDYQWVSSRLRRTMSLSIDERRRLAYKAYRHVALYDLSVAQFLGGRFRRHPGADHGGAPRHRFDRFH